MLRRSFAVVLLLGLPAVSFGQGNSERFLSPGSQFYLRWDGFAAHRPAFEKTAAGQMLQGETGTFLSHLWKYVNEQGEILLQQADPDAARIVKEIPRALSSIGRNGFSMSIELSQVHPPAVQAVFVFPRSGGDKGALAKLVKNILEVTRAETKELRIEEATFQHFAMDPLQWAFGSEGDTAIMVVGTVDPAGVVTRGSGRGKNISHHPLHKKLQQFKEFPTWSQGFIDVADLSNRLGNISPEVARLIEDLGLNGLKNVTFQSGFDGTAGRSVMDLNMNGERKGLLLFTKGRKFSMKDLPVLPSDVSAFSAGSMDAPLMYDSVIQVIDAGIRMFAGDGAFDIKEGAKGIEGVLGFKIRDDLLASLGDIVVTYASPAEGPLGMGRVTMVQVKDAKKLIDSFEKLHATFPGFPGLDIDVKKRVYRGVDIAEVHLGNTFSTPTFAILDGWLVFSNYPQPVHGYILRSKGLLPTWKADEKFDKAMEPFPKEFVSVSYSDPRPGVQMVLSLVPPIMSAVNGAAKQFVPNSKSFDVSTIPHPQEATRHLFPNISVTTEQPNRIRYDNRTSLAFPF